MAHTLSGLRFTEFALLTLRLNEKLVRAGDLLVKDLGLTSSRWQILAAIGEDGTTVARLARRLGVSRQGVQRTAARLVSDGFAGFRSNPFHKRSPLLTLTEAGIGILREVRVRHEAWADQIGKCFNAAELAATCRTLATLHARLEGHPSMTGETLRDDDGES
jgi:DNA-binding MarR family transcriptional regulator